MAENETLSLEQYKDELIADMPHIEPAILLEKRGLEASRKVREDLKELRKAMGVKQSAIAEFLGMTQSAVSRVEIGEGDLGFLTIYRYAAALGMQPTISFVPGLPLTSDENRTGVILKALERLSASRAGSWGERFGRNERGEIMIGGNAVQRADMLSAMSGALTQDMSHSLACLFSMPKGPVGKRSNAQKKATKA